MITLTRVIREMRPTATLFKMPAVRWFCCLLMFIPPITRKRMPTVTYESNFIIQVIKISVAKLLQLFCTLKRWAWYLVPYIYRGEKKSM